VVLGLEDVMPQTLFALFFLLASPTPQDGVSHVVAEKTAVDSWEKAIAASKQFESVGKLAEARKTLVAAMRDVSDSPSRLAYGYNNLGAISQQLGKYPEAEKDYRLALKQWERLPGDVGVAKTLGNIAALNFVIGRLDVADDYLNRAQAVQIAALGPDHPETALLLQNRASMHLGLHQYEKAEPEFRRVLAIWEKYGTAYELEIASTIRSLAIIYKHTSRAKEAVAFDERAKGIWEREVAKGYANPEVRAALARLYLEAHEPLRAEPILKEAIRIVDTELGPDYPYTGAILKMYADVFRQTGRKSEAKQAEQRAKLIEDTCSQLCQSQQTISTSDLLAERFRFR
jgi:tetratricopeptide (TPR) repeat protein